MLLVAQIETKLPLVIWLSAIQLVVVQSEAFQFLAPQP